ncbi:MAG: ClC family H(+)/Cl(-) exchange transporter [Spirochaetaceae bacterium]|jgi:H+/Cl- antiporter ClcA|nr:ClC family H(+)/Cl(-) exchange transporter [Spirochaetaceae bacterium]
MNTGIWAAPPQFKKTLRALYNSRLATILESMLIGLMIGLLIAAFRVILARLLLFRVNWYKALSGQSWQWWALTAAVLAALGILTGLASKIAPNIKGSGIPQVKGVLLRFVSFNWRVELPLKYISTLAALGAGLSLGREGPSVQIGAYIGMAVLTIFRRPYEQRKRLLMCASAAGLSAAFNAPLAGVLFALEELSFSLKPLYIACALGASVAADFSVAIVFGLNPVFNFTEVKALSHEHFPWIVLLGIICAVIADIFKRVLYTSGDIYAALPVPQIVRPVLPFLLTIPLCILFFDITGGGHELIEDILQKNSTLQMLALLLVLKILYTGICFGSGCSGGIFLPLLACGALCGVITARLLSAAGFLENAAELNFMILGMCAFFTAVVKAPLTGIVLVLEMSGNMYHLADMVLAAFSAFLCSELIASRPVYNVLLERFAGLRAQTVDIKGSGE